MDVLNLIIEWRNWILAIPAVAAIVWVWGHREKIGPTWRYLVSWYNLPKTLEGIDRKMKDRPLSNNAHLCPDCDTRMQLKSNYGEGAYFKCPACSVAQFYKTKH